VVQLDLTRHKRSDKLSFVEHSQLMITTNTIEHPLPQEMQHHTYSIMYQVEGSHWWFAGRRRIIESFLKPICAKIQSDRPSILDVGCGTGANLEMLAQFGEASGVDVSTEALAFCRQRGLQSVRLGEAEHLPYEDATFDLVTGLDVVEHLDDDIAGLREMHRVLRPGGYAFLFVPAFMFLWGMQDDISHHRRRYTRAQIEQAVRTAGFEIERSTYANLTFFAPILLGRLLMRTTGLRPASENNLTIGALNGILGRVLGAESSILRHMNFPFGVSAICVARRID
jgi:SAM-dependent methyltransferase